MKPFLAVAAAASFMTLATPAFAADTINLSATNTAAGSSTYTFAAGTYEVSLIDGLYKAWAPARIGVDANGANIPGSNWTDYYKYTIDNTTSFYNPLNSARFATADAAFAAYSATGPLTLTFTVPTAVTFAIADDLSSFGDNSGGVSLSVSAVPEPATWATMVLGFFGLGFAMRRKTRETAVAAIA